jgi:hypothetical protein
MNTLFRSTLLVAVLVMPVAAFAQSNVPVNEMQVETIAYEIVLPDSAQGQGQAHLNSVSSRANTQAAPLSDPEFNPAADVGLKSIYVRH